MSNDEKLYTTVGSRIRIRREQAHLTQDKLAQRVGLTRTSITNIELGKQKLLIHTLYEIADALGISPLALLPLQDEQEITPLVQESIHGLGIAESKWVEQVLTGRS